MQREPGNQQDRGAVGMAGDINQRAIGIAAAGHQRGQRALPAAPQQRAGQSGSIEIGGRLHRYLPAMLLQNGPFLGQTRCYTGCTAARRSVLRNSVTLQPSLHCSLTVYEAHLCGAWLDCPPFKPLSIESRLMPTIALVDDDRNILTSVSIALEAEGYRIMTYTDGARRWTVSAPRRRTSRSSTSRCRAWTAWRRCAGCGRSPICR